jgi:uncharacterized repeat protein (TIGR04138 family)
MNATLFNLSRSDNRYAYEAYEFVLEAVKYTQERLEPDADEPPHFRGDDLLRGGCELAVHQFGRMAPIVLRQWGIAGSDDFGEIVYRLIEAGSIARSDDDDPADFLGDFDFFDAVGGRYEFDTAAYPAGKAA